ncbi:uncharacterized protein LOC122088380 [Macadamia integrifolia]|uniref:uncharacterized protein LOC122088380 n=1 Tax=Macadamia integrifolia TaxID=60698 RepID=UPI001C4EF766|nr:uncharacterized protein LOC122088380 [Macadamia integrifolia]
MSNPNVCGSTSGNDNTSGSGKRGRGQRGRTKAHDIINMTDGERIQIEVNEWGQPCEGKSTAKLTTWIGTLAMNHLYCPLTYPKWTNIPQSYKEDCWKAITAKFIIPEVFKTWCLDRLAKRLKDHKCDLKAEYYSKYDSPSDRRKNIDLQLIPLEQWDALLKLWDDKKHKELSDRNKKNKSKQKMRHRMGRTSYAVIREKLRNEDPEKKLPNRIKMFDFTHKRPGFSMDDESAKKLVCY